MATTDVEGKLVEGLVAIVDGLTGLQGVMGRSSVLIVAWQPLAPSPGGVALPIVVYQVLAHQTKGGTGDNRTITVQFSCLAEGNNAQAIARAMVEQLELGITEPALAAQNLNAMPMRPWSRPPAGQDAESTRNLQRADLTMDFWITK